jgi:hypothetical protein
MPRGRLSSEETQYMTDVLQREEKDAQEH